MADNKLISKINLNGTIYDIKDDNARTRLLALEEAVSLGIQIVIVNNLPTASEETIGKIYFVPCSSETEKNIYDEYLTISKGTESSPEYFWEKIGTTDIDLSDYAKNGHTHRVTSNVVASEQKYLPTGNITLPTFTSVVNSTTDVVATVTNIGTAYSMTDGAVSQAADTKSSFATEGLIATYIESTNTLALTTASKADAVTAAGAITYTKPILSGSLPTFGTKTVVTETTVETTADEDAIFTGVEEDITPTLINNTVISNVNINPED